MRAQNNGSVVVVTYVLTISPSLTAVVLGQSWGDEREGEEDRGPGPHGPRVAGEAGDGQRDRCLGSSPGHSALTTGDTGEPLPGPRCDAMPHSH